MAEFINELKYGDIAKYGRRGDTMIAHINPNEAAMLKRMGGAGTINPMTGLPEFYEGSDWSDGVSGSHDDGMGDAAAWNEGSSGTGGGTGVNEGLSDEDTSYQDALAAAEYAAEQNAMLAEAEANAEAAWSRAGPSFGLDGTYAYDAIGPYGGPQQSGATLAESLYKSNPDAYNVGFTSYIRGNPGATLEDFEGFLAGLGAKGVADFANAVGPGGYRYGGPEATLADIQNQRIDEIYGNPVRKAFDKILAERETEKDDPATDAPDTVASEGFFDSLASSIGSILGFGDKSVFGPGGPSLTTDLQAEALAELQEDLAAQGIEFSPMSGTEKGIGFGLSFAPAPVGTVAGLYGALANIAGKGVLGTVSSPFGDLHLHADGTLSRAAFDENPDEGGNPFRDKNRVTSSEPKKEEEKKEEEEEKVAEKKEIKSSEYQNYLADLLYPNTSDIFKKAV